MSNRKADNLLLFKSIVDSGSLSTAAKICNISISQASKRMTHLETTLGIKLLHRSTRKLALSPPGEILYNKLQVVKQQIDEAWQCMLEYGHAPRGNMQVAAPHYYGLTYLMHFIHEFNEKHQQINVALHLANNGQDKQDACFDLMFVSHQLNRGEMIPDSNLSAKKILSERQVFVASTEYLQKHGRPKSPVELNQHHCLAMSDSQQNWTFYQGDKVIQQEITSSFLANNFEAVCQAAVAGMGIALIPETLYQQHKDQFEKLFTDYETASLDTYAYYDANQLATKKVNLFLQEIQKVNQAA